MSTTGLGDIERGRYKGGQGNIWVVKGFPVGASKINGNHIRIGFEYLGTVKSNCLRAFNSAISSGVRSLLAGMKMDATSLLGLNQLPLDKRDKAWMHPNNALVQASIPGAAGCLQWRRWR